MKNINKSFALLCMGFAAVACVEENFEDNTPKYDTTPGNEIVFSATAGIENGMPEPETKTVYGDPGTDEYGKKWIEINWDGDKDMIQIVSPEAAGPEVGHYRVGSNTPSEGFSQTHQSASVTKLGDGALQWSESDEYTFYGVYPSFAYDSDTKHGATATLTREGVFTGSMPIDQNYTLEGDETNGWVAKPDMRYAFMTASDTYKRAPAEGEDDNRTDAEKAINLEFKSMVTALQFDIKPGEIDITTEEGKHYTTMDVISVSLLSADKNISGGFEYDIPTGTYTSKAGTKMVSLHFDQTPVVLNSGTGHLNVTFFILPEDFTEDGNIQLQIIFKIGSTQMSRIATIKKGIIEGGKKYVFNNVQLPPFTGNKVPASSWWDTLDPNTILPQISIPVAANVFANSAYGVTQAHFQQQTQKIETLWAMGVRGFEICCQTAAQGGTTAMYNDGTTFYYSRNSTTYTDAATRSLKNCRVVAAQNFVGTSENMTFHKAFNSLCELLKKSEGAENECLFVICTYMAKNDGYCPYTYISNLVNYLDWYCSNNDLGITEESFKMISDATTVGDLRGKIAIIVRPGDNERWAYQNDDLTNPGEILGLTDSEVATSNLTGLISSKLAENSQTYARWKSNIMLIEDWGNEAYDVWDRRYGNTYARQAVFNQKLPASRAVTKSYFEDYLWAATLEDATLGSNSYSSTSADRDFPSSVPIASTYNYEHTMSNGSKAYIQEWMRVIPDGGLGPIAAIKDHEGVFVQRDFRTIWVKWPGSYKEKKTAIENLFEKVVETGGKKFSDIYINVLSGYYADWSYSQAGLVPQKSIFSTSNGNVTPSGPGQGGDFARLAKDLNKYTYDLLSAEVRDGMENTLDQVGPWGLVMMDHISAAEDTQTGFASADLVELIMMNNFKFDMTTTPSGGQGGEGSGSEGGSTGTASVKDYDSVYLDGQNAISFE